MVASRAMERTSETKNIAVLFSLALKGQRMTFRGILDRNMRPVYDSARRQGYEIWNRTA